MTNIVKLPTAYFPDPLRGFALSLGKVFIGVVDLDPTVLANRIVVTVLEEDGTLVPIATNAQPFILNDGGLFVFNGSVVQLQVDSDFSMTVQDSTGSQKYFFPNSNSDIVIPATTTNRFPLKYTDGVSGDGLSGTSVETFFNITLAIGDQIITDSYNSTATLTSDGLFQYTGNTVVGKAGNTPDPDGFFYDADGKQFELVGPSISPHQSAVVGDGSTDDRANLAIALLQAQNRIIEFDGSKTYKISSSGSADNLLITAPTQLKFNGATLKHVVTGGTNNNILTITSTFDTVVTWTETILKGATTLTVTTSLSVGSTVLLELGEDPDDSAQADYYRVVTVLANSGTVLTIDDSIPYDINTTGQVLYPILSLAENIEIDAVTLDLSAVSGTPNIQISIRAARNVHIKKLVILDGSIGVSVGRGSENIRIDEVVGNVIDHGFGATGRALTAWGSRNINMGLIDIHSVFDGAVVFFENLARGIDIDVLRITRNLSSAPSVDLVRSVGDSRVHIGQLEISGNQDERVVFENQDGRIDIDKMIVNTTAKIAPLLRTQNLEYKETEYGRYVAETKPIRILGALTAYTVDLFNGHARKIWIYIDDLTGFTSVFYRNSNGDALNITSTLSAGNWVNIGTVQNFNDGNPSYPYADVDFPSHNIRFNTDSTADANMIVYIEHFPDSQGVGSTHLGENYGAKSITPDANGLGTIAHGLNKAPTAAVVGIRGDNVNGVDVQSLDATNLTVRVKNASGADVTTGTFTIDWIAKV